MKNENSRNGLKDRAHSVVEGFPFVIMVLLLLSMLSPSFVVAGAKKAAIDGSFITEELCGFWSDARWQQEFAAMKEAGMHYIIIQQAANSYPGKITKTIYPSKLSNTEMAKDRRGVTYPDVIDALLRNAETAGMKVFIGIDMSDNWWRVYANDTTWLYDQMRLDNRICDELWSRYKSKYPKAFYGWYWSYEVDNVNWATDAEQQVLINAMNIQLDHLDASGERLPFMWCPFMNGRLGNPDGYENMWKNVFAKLHTAKGDIFCPQDCVGAGGLKFEQVPGWFAALRRAVDTKPGLEMWSDVETFDLTDNTTAPIGRVVGQLKMEQPYVDNYITWEYVFYDSPNNTDPGYQTTYLDYLKTGSVENVPPTPPSNFTAVVKSGGDAALSWAPSKDNIGVCGYYVYRNGKVIFRNQVPKVTGHRNRNIQLTSLTDRYLRANTSYTYQVKAYDFAGNFSVPTPAITVNTGEIKVLPNNVSIERPYSVSIPDYTDSSAVANTKLTDGLYAEAATTGDRRWEGFKDTHQTPRDVVIDLGRTMPVQQFIADFLLDPDAGVFLPERVTVLVSSDSSSFKSVGEFPRPNVPYDAPAASYKYRLTLSKPVSARYVEFRTVPSVRWYDELTFQDELEVRNDLASGTK